MDTKSISKVLATGTVLVVLLAGCNLPASAPAPTASPTLVVSEEPPVPTAAVPTLPPPPTVTSTPSMVQNPPLTSMAMIDRQTGWGLTANAVLRTRDGGVSWEDVSPGGLLAAQSGLSADFLDTMNGWVLAPNPDGINGTLHRSGDGGNTWLSSQAPFSSADLQFLDPLNGWALASLGAAAGSMPVEVYQTTDGGASWGKTFGHQPEAAETPGSLPMAGIKSGLGARDMQSAWVGGSQPQEGYVWLFATQDSGLTWQQVNLTLPEGYEQAFVEVSPPHFYSDQEGVLPVALYLGDSPVMVFYQTLDGGATWNSSEIAPTRGPYAYASLNDLWDWGEAGFYASRDGGDAWSEISANLDLSQSLGQLDFVDSQVGWAISWDASGNSALYQTLDGGQIWQAPGSPPVAVVSTPVSTPTATQVPAATPLPTNTPAPTTVSYEGPAKRDAPTIKAMRLNQKPTIDGQLDEWSLERTAVESVVFGKNNWSGTSDLSGKVMLGWNDSYLFVAVRVYDDIHAQNATGEDIYKGDEVELQFDVKVSADYYLNELSGEDYQIGISAGAPGTDGREPEAFLYYPDKKTRSLDEVQIGVVYVDDGYKMEAAIPWEILTVIPQSGLNLGFAFSISDNDNTASNVQQSLVSNVAGRMLTNPMTWGNLTLVTP